MEGKITFSNGQEIKVKVNGSSYIVEKKPDFPTNLKNISIETDEGVTVIKNGEIIECASLPDDPNYWFTVIEIPQQTLKENAIDQRIADIEDALCEISK